MADDEDDTIHDAFGIYHLRTRLPDGTLGLMPDTGAHDSLSGSMWVRDVAAAAAEAGHASTQQRCTKPRSVQGVGKGQQICEYECTIPVGLQDTSGESYIDDFSTPIVEDSGLPGLLGTISLGRLDALMLVKTGKLRFLGACGV